MRPFAPRVALWVVAASIAGCGYTLGFREPAGVERLAVPTFRNETFPIRREIEFELTRAVRQQLELGTDFVLSSEDRADATLEGTVVGVQQRVLTEGPLDRVEETSLTVTVHIQLVRRDGAVLLDRWVTDNAAFFVTGGETEDDARQEAVAQLAERIVASLEDEG
ncbi:MAG: LPS assembly lipoprotein LptE [Planctomycetota bacterium]